jgi:hypothetical protein
MVGTRVIVRLLRKNRMVTKDYQRGVYDWGQGKSGPSDEAEINEESEQRFGG